MKILVRLPNWLGDIMMSFPFLHALHDEYPQAEFIFIVKPAYKDLLALLPFKVQVVEYDKNLHGSLPHDIHKFAVNQKMIFNVDLYFCLPPSFSAAWMGYAFRAKERIGFTGEWRSMLLTHKEERPKNLHRYQEYLSLMRLHNGKDVLNYPKIRSIEFTKFFEDDVPYVVVNVNSEASSRRLPTEKWVELLELFENQKFVFIGMEKEKLRVEEVIQALPPAKNQYINLAGKTSILTLAQLLSHSQGLITNDSGPSHLASYVGTAVAVFFGAGDPNNTAPTYGKGEVMVVREPISCSPCLKNECPIKTLDCLKLIPMAPVMDKIYNFFYLK